MTCPRCKKPLAIPSKKVGASVKCPSCGAEFVATWPPTATTSPSGATKPVATAPPAPKIQSLHSPTAPSPLPAQPSADQQFEPHAFEQLSQLAASPPNKAQANKAQANKAQVTRPAATKPKTSSIIVGISAAAFVSMCVVGKLLPTPGSNPALERMKHSISAMPTDTYQRLMAAFNAEDPNRVVALLNGINGYSLFSPAELDAISSPGPFAGHSTLEGERLERQDAGVAYQHESVDSFSHSGWFYAGDAANKYRRKYKDIDFYTDYNKYKTFKVDLSGKEGSMPDYEGGQHIAGISSITFITAKDTEVEVDLDKQSGKPRTVRCHKENRTRYDPVPDSRRVWNRERNMYETEGFVRRASYTEYGKKLFKSEFNLQTGRAEIIRGSYE